MGYFHRFSWGSQLAIGLIRDTRVDPKRGPIIGLMWDAFIDLVGIFNFYRFNLGRFL